MAEEEKQPILSYKLSTPIHDGVNSIAEIKIYRRPTGGDLVGFPITAPTIPDFLRVAQKLTKIPYPVLSKMDAADSVDFAGELANFFVRE